MQNATLDGVSLNGIGRKMEGLETIAEVFAFNVRKMRGQRKQHEIATALGMHTSGYQRYEAGILPRDGVMLKALARALGCRETELFLDPDLRKPTPEEALKVIEEAIKGRK